MVSSNLPICIPIVTTEERMDPNSWIYAGIVPPAEPYDRFCRAVGEAIFAWAMVENQLFAVYATSLRSGSNRGAQASWRAMESFRTKLEITDSAAMASDIPDFNAEAWLKLKERCRKNSLRRNKIAHGTPYYDHNASNPDRRFFICTPTHEGALDKRDYLNDVVSLKNAFQMLQSDIRSFWFSLIKD